MDGLRRPVAILATIGFVASLLWHLLTLLGHAVPGGVAMVLFVGIFVVWIPTVLYLQRFSAVLRSGWGWQGWKHVALGAPTWMKVVVPVAFVYAMVNFFLATGLQSGSVSTTDPGFDRVGSGHALVFYGVAMLVMTAAMLREEQDLDWRCERGHPMPPDGKFCGECGAPARNRLHRAGA